MKAPAPLSCPSAQADMKGAHVFAVVSGSATEPQVAYLKPDAEISEGLLKEVGPEVAAHAFRFSATCEENRCCHYDGRRCGLGRRISQGLDPVVDSLPVCQIRSTCRWFAENGREVCLRCPQVVTYVPESSGRLSEVALIPTLTL